MFHVLEDLGLVDVSQGLEIHPYLEKKLYLY